MPFPLIVWVVNDLLGAQSSTHFNSVTAPASKQAWLTCAVEVIRTWGACKQYREEVDAYSDGIEKRKGSEAVGDGVHLWRSVSETRLVLPGQQHYTARVNQNRSGR